eukprot:GHVN01105620.1.p1 GENE.GHVN01105620.1~~GHVN01105620.1.p1  ORF type:complete len:618 (-),score=53.33 GHVN01105620.1:393-2246(-)
MDSKVVLQSEGCPVVRATVFKKHAAVVRRLNVPCSNMVQTVVLTGLTKHLKPDTVRVKPSAKCTVQDVAIEIQTERDRQSQEGSSTPPAASPRSTKETELIERLKALSKGRRIDIGEAEILSCRKQIVEGKVQSTLVADGGKREGLVMERSQQEVLELLNFHKSELLNVLERLATLHERLKVTDTDIMRLQCELNDSRASLSTGFQQVPPNKDVHQFIAQYSNSGTAINEPYSSTYCLHIKVEFTQENSTQKTFHQEIELEVSYMVDRAGWTAAYDLRYDSYASTLRVIYMGVISQQTEEDWADVSLHLSTADPCQETTPRPIPSLEARLVSAWPLDAMPNSFHGGGEAVESTKDKPMVRTRYAEMLSGSEGSSFSGVSLFSISSLTSVSSSINPQQVRITDISLPADVIHFGVPARSSQAYLHVKTKNISDYPFVTSQAASVYIDAAYVSKNRFPAVSRGESFVTLLGVDPAIQIHYNLRTKDRETGLLSKVKQQTVTAETTISNSKPTPIKFLIVQDFPRSQDDRVKVKMEHVCDESGARDQDWQEVSVSNDLEVWYDPPHANQVTPPRGALLLNTNRNHLIFMGNVGGRNRKRVEFEHSVEWPVSETLLRKEVI